MSWFKKTASSLVLTGAVAAGWWAFASSEITAPHNSPTVTGAYPSPAFETDFSQRGTDQIQEIYYIAELKDNILATSVSHDVLVGITKGGDQILVHPGQEIEPKELGIINLKTAANHILYWTGRQLKVEDMGRLVVVVKPLQDIKRPDAGWSNREKDETCTLGIDKFTEIKKGAGANGIKIISSATIALLEGNGQRAQLAWDAMLAAAERLNARNIRFNGLPLQDATNGISAMGAMTVLVDEMEKAVRSHGGGLRNYSGKIKQAIHQAAGWRDIGRPGGNGYPYGWTFRGPANLKTVEAGADKGRYTQWHQKTPPSITSQQRVRYSRENDCL